MALGEACYEAWLRDTYSEWAAHGRRDRVSLHARLVAALSERHGEVNAAHIAALLMAQLEHRARREGDNFQGSPMQ